MRTGKARACTLGQGVPAAAPCRRRRELTSRRATADSVLVPAQPSLPRELWDFLRVRKKWWLGPIVLVLVLFGALVVFTQGSAFAPFIYTIF